MKVFLSKIALGVTILVSVSPCGIGQANEISGKNSQLKTDEDKYYLHENCDIDALEVLAEAKGIIKSIETVTDFYSTKLVKRLEDSVHNIRELWSKVKDDCPTINPNGFVGLYLSVIRTMLFKLLDKMTYHITETIHEGVDLKSYDEAVFKGYIKSPEILRTLLDALDPYC